MKSTVLAFFGIMGLFISITTTGAIKPKANGAAEPGCSCHSKKALNIKTRLLDNNLIEVTIDAPGGEDVAGELIDPKTNKVVDMINNTPHNPFTLKVPGEGTFVVYAGYWASHSDNPWDSVSVDVKLSGISQASNEAGIELLQNHPNPVKDLTLIRYYLPEPASVDLTLYDGNGREILTLDEGLKNEGYHQAYLDASILQQGSFEYVLSAGRQRIVRKMIVVK